MKFLSAMGATAMLLSTPVQAQWSPDQFLHDWTGRYTCAGTTMGITLNLDRKDGRSAVVGTVNFYPVDGGPGEEGSYHTRLRIGQNPFDNGRGRWIVQPDGYDQIPMHGELVGGEIHAWFDYEECEPFVLVPVDSPGADQARIIVPEAERPPEPTVVVATTDRSFVGVWEGHGACTRGPHDFILKIYPSADENGNNATYEAIPRDLPIGERAIYTGVFGEGSRRWPLQFVPVMDQPDPLRVGPLTIKGDMSRWGIDGRTDELGCLSVNLEHVSSDPGAWGQDDSTIIAEIPEELRAYEGAWDGGWFDEDGAMHQVSMIVEPSTAGIMHRYFDVTFGLDQRSGTVALVQDRVGELNFVTITEGGQATSLRLGGEIRSEVLDQSGLEYFIFRISGGNGFVMRRPEGQDRSLRDMCETSIDAWAGRRQQARELARDLKVEFYPALAGYDEVKASFADAFSGKSKLPTDDFVSLAYQCLLTSPQYNTWVQQGIFDGVIATSEIADMRNWMQRFGEIKGRLTHAGDTISGPTAEQIAAEDDLDKLVAEYSPANVAGILAFVEAQSELVDQARPSRLADILAPLGAALNEAENRSAGDFVAARIASAEARMSGIAVPQLPIGREDDFAALVGGRLNGLSSDQVAFFGGVVGEAIETCGLPASIEERLTVSGILFSGIDRALFGDGFAAGDLGETLGTSLTGTSEYMSGADAVETMGCSSPYLDITLAALSDLAKDRAVPASGRASLFIRSCSLDRSSTQCGCIEAQLETLFPSVAQQEYDRGYLARSVRMNPLVSIKLVSMCQVGDY